MPRKPTTHSERRAKADARARRQVERRVRRNRRPAPDPRSTWRWTKLSRLRRRKFPICETPDCENPSDQVDHIQSLETHPHLAYSWPNLQALCTSCHARKSAEERKAAT